MAETEVLRYRKLLKRSMIEKVRNALPAEVAVQSSPTLDEIAEMRFPIAVLVVRETIEADRYLEVNPGVGTPQEETWTWALRVVGGAGGGGTTAEATEDVLDEVLEVLQERLQGDRLKEPECGPLHFVGETYDGDHPSGAIITQRWSHLRYGRRSV